MLIASKFRETIPLGIRRLVALTKNSVDERMIKVKIETMTHFFTV